MKHTEVKRSSSGLSFISFPSLSTTLLLAASQGSDIISHKTWYITSYLSIKYSRRYVKTKFLTILYIKELKVKDPGPIQGLRLKSTTSTILCLFSGPEKSKPNKGMRARSGHIPKGQEAGCHRRVLTAIWPGRSPAQPTLHLDCQVFRDQMPQILSDQGREGLVAVSPARVCGFCWPGVESRGAEQAGYAGEDGSRAALCKQHTQNLLQGIQPRINNTITDHEEGLLATQVSKFDLGPSVCLWGSSGWKNPNTLFWYCIPGLPFLIWVGFLKGGEEWPYGKT